MTLKEFKKMRKIRNICYKNVFEVRKEYFENENSNKKLVAEELKKEFLSLMDYFKESEHGKKYFKSCIDNYINADDKKELDYRVLLASSGCIVRQFTGELLEGVEEEYNYFNKSNK